MTREEQRAVTYSSTDFQKYEARCLVCLRKKRTSQDFSTILQLGTPSRISCSLHAVREHCFGANKLLTAICGLLCGLLYGLWNTAGTNVDKNPYQHEQSPVLITPYELMTFDDSLFDLSHIMIFLLHLSHVFFVCVEPRA